MGGPIYWPGRAKSSCATCRGKMAAQFVRRHYKEAFLKFTPKLLYYRGLKARIWTSHMALLPILQYPDRRLHKIAKPVEQVDDRIRELVRNMAETMYAAPGIGLAADRKSGVWGRSVSVRVDRGGGGYIK